MKNLVTIALALAHLSLSAQMGNFYGDAGTIGAHLTQDGEVAIYTIQSPSPSNPVKCRLEYWYTDGTGQRSGTFAYTDCSSQDTFYFPVPIGGEFHVRKRVFWQTSAGTKWRTTNEVKPILEIITNPVTTSATVNGAKFHESALQVETDCPVAVLVLSGWMPLAAYELPGSGEVDLTFLPGGVFQVYVFFMCAGLPPEQVEMGLVKE